MYKNVIYLFFSFEKIYYKKKMTNKKYIQIHTSYKENNRDKKCYKERKEDRRL